jgi:hypothetical protein
VRNTSWFSDTSNHTTNMSIVKLRITRKTKTSVSEWPEPQNDRNEGHDFGIGRNLLGFWLHLFWVFVILFYVFLPGRRLKVSVLWKTKAETDLHTSWHQHLPSPPLGNWGLLRKLTCSEMILLLKMQIHDAYLFETRDGMNKAWKTWWKSEDIYSRIPLSINSTKESHDD